MIKKQYQAPASRSIVVGEQAVTRAGSLYMEMMEPRTLLSADALALAGLPGADNHNDEAPWAQVELDDSGFAFSTATTSEARTETPIEYTAFADDSLATDNDSATAISDDMAPATRADALARTEIVFVDMRVPDYENLIEGIRNAKPDTMLITYVLDPEAGGVAQIDAALGGHADIDAVHLLSHGSTQGLQLGNEWLSQDNIADYAEALRGWGDTLDAEADLLIYGCNLAADESGRSLIDALAGLIGADVAASDDLTGQAALGGDWELEHEVGDVQTTVIADAAIRANWVGVLNEDYQDDFDEGDYTGSDGATTWVDPWVETNDDGSESSGDVQVVGGELVFSETTPTDTEVTRPVDLSGSGTATLSFDYQRTDDPVGGSLSVEVYDGVAWNQVANYDLTVGDAAPMSESIDITAYKDAASEIGFFKNTATVSAVQIAIDNVRVELVDTNSAPAVANNTITLSQGDVVAIDSSILSGSDADSGDTNLTIGVTNVSNGHFAYATNLDSEISTFTTNDIAADSVRFVHDGGEIAPQYSVTVYDGTTDSGPAQAATVNFNDTVQGVVWFSTNDHNDPGNFIPGLDGQPVDRGDILQMAGTDLSFGENGTDGTFSQAFDISNFGTDANINGMHFVTSDITIGAANSVDLQAGDLLLTTEDNKTLISNGASPAPDLPVDREDIVYFRPDQPGDYSKGNFYLLFSDPFGGDKELRGISLVEHDVVVGGELLNQGDMLLLRSGGGEHGDVWVFDTSTIDTQDEGSYSAPQKLIEGSDSNVSFDEKLYGIDVLEKATTIGAQTYAAGSLLVSVDQQDFVGDTNQRVAARDIAILTVNSATLGSGDADVSADILVDGDDVALVGEGEPIDGFTLTVDYSPVNVIPALNTNLLTVAEGQTATVDSTMLSASDPDGPDSALTFNVSSVSGGQFELTSSTGTAVLSFTQAQVDASQVVFVDDGDEFSPSFDVSISDGVDTTGVMMGGVNFANVNDAPSATNLLTTATYNEGDTSVAITDIVVSDDDLGETITATLTLANAAAGALSANSGASYNAGTGVWSITNSVANVNTALANLVFNPATNNDQNTTISVEIDDGDEDGGGPLTGTVNLNVTPQSDAPVAGVVVTVNTEDDAGFTVDLLANSSDPDTGDTLSVANLTLASGDPRGITDNGDGTLSIDPNAYTGLATGESEVVTYNFDVSDGTTTTGTTATITIDGANDLPTIVGIDVFANEDDAPATVDLTTFSSDPDVSDSLAVSNLSLVSGDASGITDNVNGTITIDPGAYNDLADGERLTIVYSYDVSDGTVTGTVSAVVYMDGVNDAPILITPVVDRSATEDLPISFQVASTTFADPDTTDTLDYTATVVGQSSLPSWLSFNSATLTFSGTPTNDDVGTYVVRVLAHDPSGDSVAAEFDLAVNNVNDVPIGAPTISGPLQAGNTVSANVSGIDDDDGVGSFSFQWLRDGDAIAGATASAYTLVDADVGAAISVIVTYTDLQGTNELVVSVPSTLVLPALPPDPETPTAELEPEVEEDAAEVTEDEPEAAGDPEDDTVIEGEPSRVKPRDVEIADRNEPDEQPIAETQVPVTDSAPPAVTYPEQAGTAASTVPVDDLDDALHSRHDVDGQRNANEFLKYQAARNPVTALLLGAASLVTDPVDRAALAGELRAVFAYSGFVDRLDDIRSDYTQALYLEKTVVGSGIAVTTGLSIGYVAWLVRGGVLLSTVLSSLPAWQFVDPLPVLAPTRKKKRDDDKDEDTVETMFGDHDDHTQ